MRWNGLAIRDAATLPRAEINSTKSRGVYPAITAEKNGIHGSQGASATAII